MEHIKTLEATIQTLWKERDEMKTLVDKLKKYETMIHCVWSDLYWADKFGCDVSFKDVSASCDYYDNEEFIKNEVVEDEEEKCEECDGEED